MRPFPAPRGLLLAARLRRAAAARHAGDGSAGDHGVLRTVARHRAAPHCSSLTARHAFLRSARHRHERRLEKRGSPPSPRARAPGELPLAANRPFVCGAGRLRERGVLSAGVPLPNASVTALYPGNTEAERRRRETAELATCLKTHILRKMIFRKNIWVALEPTLAIN